MCSAWAVVAFWCSRPCSLIFDVALSRPVLLLDDVVSVLLDVVLGDVELVVLLELGDVDEVDELGEVLP